MLSIFNTMQIRIKSWLQKKILAMRVFKWKIENLFTRESLSCWAAGSFKFVGYDNWIALKKFESDWHVLKDLNCPYLPYFCVATLLNGKHIRRDCSEATTPYLHVITKTDGREDSKNKVKANHLYFKNLSCWFGKKINSILWRKIGYVCCSEEFVDL